MTNSRKDLVPRPPRTVPPPRRRPVAGTRGRRPSAGPADAPPVGLTDSTTDETDESVAAVEPAKPTAKVGGGTDRPRPSPAPSPSAKPKPKPQPKVLPASDTGDREGTRRAAADRDGRRSGAGLWLLPGLVLLTVLLLAATGVLGGFVWQRQRTVAASKAALPAARSHAKEILSYDYRRIDADIRRAKADTTGSFSKEYADTSKTVKPLALQYHVIVEATVKASSVVSSSSDKVVVLLFVDQKTTSTRIAGPKTDQSRVRITLVKAGGKWLVSKIDAL